MAYINDTQPVPLNNTVETNQPSAPPYYQTNIQTEQIRQNPQGVTYIQPGGGFVTVPGVTNMMPVVYYAPRGTASTTDTLNIVWSVFNTLCCLWPVGLIALIISIVTLKKRRRGDDQGALCCGISAAIINLLATVGGLLLIFLYLIPLLNRSSTY